MRAALWSLLAIPLVIAVMALTPATAVDAPAGQDGHVKGQASAPVTIIEYASFTCSHCSDFYNDVMPKIEENYIKTGKVKFVFRDFPIDAYGLKASALTHCMPKEQYWPFVKVLFENYSRWVHSLKPEQSLLQYAQMAGLTAEKATACMENTALLDEIVAIRTEGNIKYGIQSTPTFVINDGEETIVGARSYETFAAAFDKALAKKKDEQPKK